jgi:hypothetical protein
MIKLLKNPIFHIQNPTRFDYSTIISAILHMYHLIFFKCNKSDLFHHLTFVLFGTLTQYLVNWGYGTALYHFFLCGLPGGIDYFLLGLAKQNVISKNSRLKYAVELNNWIRAPGAIFTWCISYIWFIYRLDYGLNLFCFIIITLASVINAQYYSRQVTLCAGNKLN